MKVQCLRLIHLLAEVSLADVFPAARLAVFQRITFESLFIRGHCTRRLYPPLEFIFFHQRHDYEKPGLPVTLSLATRAAPHSGWLHGRPQVQELLRQEGPYRQPKTRTSS